MAQRAKEILPGMLKRAGVPSDRCIVIDSEMLFATDNEPCTFAICRSEQVDDSVLERELCNDLGEFDVAHTKYLRSPALQAIAGDACVLVDTVDTDMLFIDTVQVLAFQTLRLVAF